MYMFILYCILFTLLFGYGLWDRYEYYRKKRDLHRRFEDYYQKHRKK